MDNFDKRKYRFSLVQPLTLIGDEITEERGNQIILMNDELSLYNILIKDLVSDCPSLDIRNQILNIAYYIIDDTECYDKISEEKKLPIEDIVKKISVPKSFLTLWQDYIITYVVILANPNYKHIQEYFRIEENVDILVGNKLVENNSDVLIKGIVISKSRKKVIVLTSKGEFKKISISEYVEIGEEAIGNEAKRLKNYRLHISIIAMLIIIMIGIISIKYTTITKTIVINTTSLIKVEVNSFDKVINAQSPTARGGEMLEKIKIQDKYMDEALYKIFKYAFENEMMPDGDVLITVSGKVMDLASIEETMKFLEDKNILVKLNNSGNEYYINQ